MGISAQNRINIKKSIAILREKFQKNNNSASWANNIIAASRHLKGEVEWAHFYHYMANPSCYDIDNLVIEHAPVEELNFQQDPRFETVEYKNGMDTVIHLKRIDGKNDNEEEKTFEDEKT